MEVVVSYRRLSFHFCFSSCQRTPAERMKKKGVFHLPHMDECPANAHALTNGQHGRRMPTDHWRLRSFVMLFLVFLGVSQSAVEAKIKIENSTIRCGRVGKQLSKTRRRRSFLGADFRKFRWRYSVKAAENNLSCRKLPFLLLSHCTVEPDVNFRRFYFQSSK